jgi:NAD(P)-dependent dehydrogenase (short-subunit alcohol dehydrogenase family)
MDLKLQGKVVLVTGAGSGIGRATALVFADEGAKVAVIDVDKKGGGDTVRLIEAKGKEAAFFECDVSQDKQVRAMVQGVVEKYGRLDCAFNNAGIEGSTLPVVEYEEEVWDRIIDINLKGVWLCMKYEIPEMLKAGGGAIVNSGSVASLMGTPGSTGYTGAKHGVLGLTKTAALEYAKAGIRINAVCPGAVHTEMIDRVIRQAPFMEKFYADVHPIGRLGKVDEIAGAVAWMCSPWASFMIGHGMVIDGGLTAP